jgi:4,5-dihydroxyphthalate decarboxylase
LTGLTARIQLTLAISEYDHVRDLVGGEVRPQAIDLVCLSLPVEEIFHRFLRYREWDVSELSLAKYVALVSQDDPSLTAIPVFPSRVFRHSAIYVRSDSELEDPRQLAGRRVGVPEWSQTAGVFMRGFLAHQYGVALQEVDWYQAGVGQPGRQEKVALRLPAGVRLTPVADRSLEQMLLAGEVDAVFSAHAPGGYERGDGSIRRLLREPMEAEREHFRATGIWPIMHVIALRSEVVERHPWVPMTLLQAFEEARDRSLRRLRETTASRVPLPWGPEAAAQAERLLGELFPYGVEANRTTLEAFLEYAHEQGVCHRKLQPEDLFPAQVQSRVRV